MDEDNNSTVETILFRTDGGTQVMRIDESAVIEFGAPTTKANAGNGETVLKQGAWHRGANNAGNDTVPLIRAAFQDSLNTVNVGDGGEVIELGAPASLVNAGAGDAVLAQNKFLFGTNSGGTAAHKLIGLNGPTMLATLPAR